jgi:hypothetical protein
MALRMQLSPLLREIDEYSGINERKTRIVFIDLL